MRPGLWVVPCEVVQAQRPTPRASPSLAWGQLAVSAACGRSQRTSQVAVVPAGPAHGSPLQHPFIPLSSGPFHLAWIQGTVPSWFCSYLSEAVLCFLLLAFISSVKIRCSGAVVNVQQPALGKQAPVSVQFSVA